jgi:hypothetical protein
MTLDERVDAICIWTDLGLRGAVKRALQLAMKDQRHACAEAVIGLAPYPTHLTESNVITRHQAHQACMNANVED